MTMTGKVRSYQVVASDRTVAAAASYWWNLAPERYMIAVYRFSLPAILPILVTLVGFGGSPALAQIRRATEELQPPADAAETPENESFEPARADGPEAPGGRSLSDEELAAVSLWIEQLGSGEFATRERAAVHLMDMGHAALPALKVAASKSADAETRLRAGQIVKQMTEGDLQTRIGEFLAGKHDDFIGWKAVHEQLGDSIPVRELFVEMMQAHPALVKSLDGTSAERIVALDEVVGKVQANLFSADFESSRADVFALLLLSTDANVMLNIRYETLLLNLAQRHVVSTIRLDNELAGPFNALFNKWMLRTSLTMRDDVLYRGMAWDMPNTLPLALRTLEETTQTGVIATCMQAISKFGDESQTDLLSRFLSDNRIVSNRGFGAEAAQPQVRDLAMLTLALLYELPLTEIGMGHISTHPTVGFELNDFAYKSKNPENERAAALERIKKLLKEHAEEAS